MVLLRKNNALLTAFLLTLCLRILLFLIGINFISRVSPFPVNITGMDLVSYIPTDTNDPWFTVVQPLHRYDALWYEEVSTNGYGNIQATSAFFPLFPQFVKYIAMFTSWSYPVASYMFTTGITFLIFYFLYTFTKQIYDERIAFRTLMVFAFFPTSFFLLSPYAESLLVLCTILVFYFLREKKFFLAGIMSFGAAMSKPYGVFILFPILVVLYQTKNINDRISILIPIFTSFLSYFMVMYMQVSESNSVAFLPAVRSAWGMTIPWPWQPFLMVWSAFIRNPTAITNLLYIFSFSFICGFLILARRKMVLPYWIMVAVFFVVFNMFSFRAGVTPSLSRYILVLFPMFMYMGSLKVSKIVDVLYITISTVLLVLSFMYYTLGFFIA